jgi:hypothetical protein
VISGLGGRPSHTSDPTQRLHGQIPESNLVFPAQTGKNLPDAGFYTDPLLSKLAGMEVWD